MRDVESEMREWDATIVAIARAVCRRFPMVSWEDTAQELRLWWISTKRVARYLEELTGEDEEAQLAAQKKLLRALSQEANAHCQREKAQALGYSVDDLFFYNTGALREILPSVYDDNSWLPFARSETERRGGGDPSEGMNLVATLSDISRAIDRLREPDQRILGQLYGQGFSEQELAEEEGVTVEAINKRHDRALVRLRDVLGGERPPLHEGPGSRRAMSRAAAMAQVGGDL